jgi:hypothetical protein
VANNPIQNRAFKEHIKGICPYYHTDKSRSNAEVFRVLMDTYRSVEHIAMPKTLQVSKTVSMKDMQPETHKNHDWAAEQRIKYLQEFPLETDDVQVYNIQGMHQQKMRWMLPMFKITAYLCAFLNADGGRVFVGVDNDQKARGVILKRDEMDEISLNLDNRLKYFQPPVRADQYEVRFLKIEEESTGNDSESVENKYIIEISINANEISDIYFTPNDECYKMRNGALKAIKNNHEIKVHLEQKMRTNFKNRLDQKLKNMTKTELNGMLDEVKELIMEKMAEF